MDIEGLDRTDEHLWVVGSHSRTRKQVADRDDADEALDALTKVRTHPNRHVVVRLPISDPDLNAAPVRSMDADGAGRTAALLDGGAGGLADVLSIDEHLAPFVGIPCKDNGLDVEGIVALDDGVLIGLRGPVLRGWAVVLELHPRRCLDAPTGSRCPQRDGRTRSTSSNWTGWACATSAAWATTSSCWPAPRWTPTAPFGCTGGPARPVNGAAAWSGGSRSRSCRSCRTVGEDPR